ncbi:MAG: ferrous iron transporter B, partial [Candidatus Omnitrophica bacterium]|nr:ferrous iron transporter B [Candidatus Omnitrophota bacterium]
LFRLLLKSCAEISHKRILVRNLILEEQPDVIVQCIDATQFKQSLLLTVDLMELEMPLVIVLNAVDETAKKGIAINAKILEELLGVAVVESVAISGRGTEQLKNAIVKARKSKAGLHYGFGVERAIVEVMAALPLEMAYKFKIAVLLLLMDPFLENDLAKRHGADLVSRVRLAVSKVRRDFQEKIRGEIYRKRHQWVDGVCEAACKTEKAATRFSQYCAQACRHPFWGIPILSGVIMAIYFSVVNVSTGLDKTINQLLVNPALKLITNWALPPFWHDFLIGNHGVLTLGVFNAVCTVLPILSVFFLVYGFVEDSGYIANFSVLMKRVFEKFGVTGGAITSIVLGFGCKTMATLTTKGLTSYKEKFITNFLILFAIPCSVQLSINIAILGKFGWSASVIAFGSLAFLEIAAGLLLNLVIKDDQQNSFIQVLPKMRFPSIKGVLIKTYYRVVWFLKEALPIFIVSAVALFAADKIGLLGQITRWINPLLVGWLGLPANITDVFILALARREAAAGLIYQMVNSGAMNYIQSIIAVVITTTFYPCFASMIALSKEMGLKTALVMSGLIVTSAFLMAGILHGLLVLIIQ